LADLDLRLLHRPGPLTFDLFERGFDARLLIWLSIVLIGTGIAGLMGQLPGVSRRPTSSASPRIARTPCTGASAYTTAWGEVMVFAVLNVAGLVYAIVTGEWRLKQMYAYGYFPIAGTIVAARGAGHLPRVRRSTAGEGHERRYFYGSVWAVAIAQPILWMMWKLLPQTRPSDIVKLVVFVGILAAVGWMARLGLLPRTRPIVPGEWAISD